MLKIETVRYTRPFSKPLQTSNRCWAVREGIVIQLVDRAGRRGYGEIAPVQGFGVETLEEAEACLSGLGSVVSESELEFIPAKYGCTRFALGSALWMLQEPQVDFNLTNCGLLPAGEEALEWLERLLKVGFIDFKLKIGMHSVEQEQDTVKTLVEMLPGDGRLRLDANGFFSDQLLRKWVHFLTGIDRVAYLEQPLPPGEEGTMAEVMAESGLLIALDESVVNQREGISFDWAGALILKSPLLGDPRRQMVRYDELRNPKIFSSVFETGIGLLNGLRLAGKYQSKWAVGYGTLGYFDDGWNLFTEGSVLSSKCVTIDDLDELWKQICKKS